MALDRADHALNEILNGQAAWAGTDCVLEKLAAAFEILGAYADPGGDALRIRVAMLMALEEAAWGVRP